MQLRRSSAAIKSHHSYHPPTPQSQRGLGRQRGLRNPLRRRPLFRPIRHFTRGGGRQRWEGGAVECAGGRGGSAQESKSEGWECSASDMT